MVGTLRSDSSVFSYISVVALTMTMLAVRSTPFKTDILYLHSYWTDIHVTKRMNPFDFGDRLSFPSSAAMSLKFLIWSELSRQILDELP